MVVFKALDGELCYRMSEQPIHSWGGDLYEFMHAVTVEMGIKGIGGVICHH